jgi:competence protein ComEC
MADMAETTDLADGPPPDQLLDATPTWLAAVIAALQHISCRSRVILSRGAASTEHFLDSSGFDRAPWLAVGYAAGIAAWFALAGRWQWLALIASCLNVALLTKILMQKQEKYPYLRQAIIAMSLMVAAGCITVWAKSELAGARPITYPMAPTLNARVLERSGQPAEGKVRLIIATREPNSNRAIKVRLTLPEKYDDPAAVEGAIIRLRARLMPPMSPQLPGGYDFARAAWFSGISATGSALGKVDIITPAPGTSWLAQLQHRLSAHVRAQIAGSAGGIAAAFASGDRGGISAADEQAMRDAGLTHLLSVSGLHVSAVIAVAYVVALRLLALFPALALRLRLPVVAAVFGGLVGIFYTLLTGAEVPTVRSCAGALMVLAAVALGREPLSLRLLAVVAMAVLFLWPEAVVGPSFQMSFGSVLAIISLHNAAPVRHYLERKIDVWWLWLWRHFLLALLTGMVIELALMPIALFHFHRSGVYGAMANIIAIPLTTFLSMPLIALALVLDMVGMGGAAWRLTGRTLDFLLQLAHYTADRPGAVTLLPSFGNGSFMLFIGAMLWLALWHGRVRLWGLLPGFLAVISLATLHAPDLLITGDGGNVGLLSPDGQKLHILRQGRSSFTRDSMLELTGMSGQVASLEDWPGSRCNKDFCLVELSRGRRMWRILIARRDVFTVQGELARACAGVDIVVAKHTLFGPCHPALIKADSMLLLRTGGLALDLTARNVRTVAQSQGQHPWWRAPSRMPRFVE